MSDKKKQEYNRLRVHEADGIQEYDNPLPRWWLGLFWFGIIFGIVYAIKLHFMGGETLLQTLALEEQALVEQQETAAVTSGAEGTTVEERLASESYQTAGQALYVANCAACHAADGGGTIGPNLTDNYWIHGHTPLKVLRTISVGVAEKGMPGWEASLGKQKVEQITAYVLTLQGTTPANPKSPQGKLVSE